MIESSEHCWGALLYLLWPLEPGDRLVFGRDDDGWFCALDYAPPVDRGPLFEAANPVEALIGLAKQVQRERVETGA